MAGDRAGEDRDQLPAAQLTDQDRPAHSSGNNDAGAVAMIQAAGPAQAAQILQRFPGQQAQMLRWLHQHRGNAFVQSMLLQMPARDPDAADGSAIAESVGSNTAHSTQAEPTPQIAGADHHQAAAASKALPAHNQVADNSHLAKPSPADKHADDVARLDYINRTAQSSASGILTSLVPAYVAARDSRDVASVAELGGSLLGAFSRLHGAKQALAELLPKVPHQSVKGASADDDLALANTQHDVELNAPQLDAMIPHVDASVADALTPHRFRGHEVAASPVVVDMEQVPESRRVDRLAGELQRTIGMLVLVEELTALLLDGKKGLDRAHLDTARGKLTPWASRPLDLAFLRAALGPIWELLDSTASGPMETKPSDMLASATKQATHTGWLGDVGRVDIDEACAELRIGGRESSEFVIRQLYSADPDTRARLLMQIKERGLLDALCSAVGWKDIKELHDGLGGGFSEIKADLRKYFLGPGKYGPRLDSEWENHDSSLHSLVARLGGVGRVLNFALDVGTFGFNSSYGKAVDDRSEGLTSEGESSRAKAHAASRTAAIAAVSVLTGGAAANAVRGGAGTVSALRATAAGAAGGSVGAVGALATSDVYNLEVSGEQKQFSSPEEYVKAALLGGVIGGAVGRVTNGLTGPAARYLPKQSAEPPAAARTADTTAASDTLSSKPPATEQVADAPKAPTNLPRTRELGLRQETLDALETFENIKRDPIGEVNRNPNNNHYKAARREAAGEVVARRPDGRPYDHVRDLQEHYNALDNVRRVFERENNSPAPGMTERGLDVLLAKYSELQQTMSRLKGFLDGIGHGPPFPPFHEWPPGS